MYICYLLTKNFILYMYYSVVDKFGHQISIFKNPLFSR